MVVVGKIDSDKVGAKKIVVRYEAMERVVMHRTI